MLVEIARPPTAENAALRLHAADNIAVARVPLAPGTLLRFGALQVTVADPVAAGHKVAVEPIRAGGMVRRYGQAIGRAAADIAPGQHVHTHNLSYEELALDYEFPAGDAPLPAAPADAPTFLGYAREDGRAGTRNYIAVVAAATAPPIPPN